MASETGRNLSTMAVAFVHRPDVVGVSLMCMIMASLGPFGITSRVILRRVSPIEKKKSAKATYMPAASFRRQTTAAATHTASATAVTWSGTSKPLPASIPSATTGVIFTNGMVDMSFGLNKLKIRYQSITSITH